MKIALVTSGFLPVVDGVTVTVFNRLQQLSQQGHQVRVFCPDYSAIAAIYPHWQDDVGAILPGVEVIPLPSEPFIGVAFERNLARAALKPLQQALETFQPDVIHVDEPDRIFLGMLTAPGVAFAQQHNIPCTAFLHTNFIEYIEDFSPLPTWTLGSLQWGSQQIIHRVFNAYDRTLVANGVTETMARQMGIRNVRRGDFLGVDLDRYRPSDLAPDFFQTHYGLPAVDPQTKLIFLGRLTPDKGWKFALKAFAKLADSLNNVAILIAGDGELQAEIQAGFQQLGLNAYFLGRIAPAAVPPLLVNGDLHVTTSTKETFGLTVLEAMAAGIPAIAPRAGGVVETLRDGETGYLFTPGDEADFGQKLLRLIGQPDLRQALGQRGRAVAAQQSWERAVGNLVEVWGGEGRGKRKEERGEGRGKRKGEREEGSE
ncbi:glycosyltransferase [Romeria aff. gracilis LEGE 07310]|uniref:Glycosyltransferase n=1 Tax=Vasconcelosia minhoensis LEGE 07310 TaxID=915328 RepID=A0A8J7AR45_9CYAN|nr:glycosyltransferase [Romeria aff. gracilis LEGE 07310]